MTLDEAMKAKKLMRLVAFRGWQPCGKLTGRYFYDNLTGEANPSDIKVEIRSFLFFKEWVYLSQLQAVKEASK